MIAAGLALDSDEIVGADRGPDRQPQLRLSLLNEFELRRDGHFVPISLVAQRLVVFLALHGRRARRPFVAGSLWPESTEHRACGNLRSAIWRLQVEGVELLEVTPTHLGLPSAVILDLDDATSLARVLTSGCELQVSSILALDKTIFTRDLLAGWYEDWVLMERERYRLLRVHALEALCERLTAAGMFALAAESGIAAVDADPLRESAHRVLIKAHLAEGNRVEAIRRFRILSDILRDDLGVEPSSEVARLLWS
jgi:DNA-binding SARP family transcriptional activator